MMGPTVKDTVVSTRETMNMNTVKTKTANTNAVAITVTANGRVSTVEKSW